MPRASASTLNRNVYPQAFHRRLLSPCLIAGSEVFFFPVVEPFRAIVLARPNEAVEFLTVLDVPALDKRDVDRVRVAEDVAVEPDIELDEDSGKAQREQPGCHARGRWTRISGCVRILPRLKGGRSAQQIRADGWGKPRTGISHELQSDL
jgi:hypothetical protein